MAKRQERNYNYLYISTVYILQVSIALKIALGKNSKIGQTGKSDSHSPLQEGIGSKENGVEVCVLLQQRTWTE